MEKLKEKLNVYFAKVFCVLEEQNKTDFIDKVISVKEDLFVVLEEYNSETADNWKDVEERLVSLAKEYEKISDKSDLTTFAAAFILMRKHCIFEKKLLNVLGKDDNEKCSEEDIRPAILIVLRELRKKIKAFNTSAFLERYDTLKNNIKKLVTGDYTDSKMRLYDLVKDEMRDSVWKDDEDIQFLSYALYLYNKNMCSKKINLLFDIFKEEK